MSPQLPSINLRILSYSIFCFFIFTFITPSAEAKQGQAQSKEHKMIFLGGSGKHQYKISINITTQSSHISNMDLQSRKIDIDVGEYKNVKCSRDNINFNDCALGKSGEIWSLADYYSQKNIFIKFEIKDGNSDTFIFNPYKYNSKIIWHHCDYQIGSQNYQAFQDALDNSTDLNGDNEINICLRSKTIIKSTERISKIHIKKSINIIGSQEDRPLILNEGTKSHSKGISISAKKVGLFNLNITTKENYTNAIELLPNSYIQLNSISIVTKGDTSPGIRCTSCTFDISSTNIKTYGNNSSGIYSSRGFNSIYKTHITTFGEYSPTIYLQNDTSFNISENSLLENNSNSKYSNAIYMRNSGLEVTGSQIKTRATLSSAIYTEDSGEHWLEIRDSIISAKTKANMGAIRYRANGLLNIFATTIINTSHSIEIVENLPTILKINKTTFKLAEEADPKSLHYGIYLNRQNQVALTSLENNNFSCNVSRKVTFKNLIHGFVEKPQAYDSSFHVSKQLNGSKGSDIPLCI
jgi:hypothetical protein